MAKRPRIAFVVAAALAIGSGRATAVEDLTGIYTGGISCKQTGDGNVFKAKRDLELVLEDLGTGQVNFFVDPFPGQAVLYPETAKPDRGVLTGLTWSLGATDLTGSVLRVDVKTKAGRDTATLKGTLTFFETAASSSGECKLTAKRTRRGR